MNKKEKRRFRRWNNRLKFQIVDGSKFELSGPLFKKKMMCVSVISKFTKVKAFKRQTKYTGKSSSCWKVLISQHPFDVLAMCASQPIV